MPRDIEEFLKMAAKRRQEQKRKAAGGQPAPARKPPVQPPSTPRPAARRPSLRPGEEIRVLGSSDVPPDMRDQSVAEHVRSHIDTSDLAEHARQLGEEVGLADDKLQARLTRKFDHSVSTLAVPSVAQQETTTITQRDVSPMASELLEMLRSPKSIRQAILISEVLRRPDFD